MDRHVGVGRRGRGSVGDEQVGQVGSVGWTRRCGDGGGPGEGVGQGRYDEIGRDWERLMKEEKGIEKENGEERVDGDGGGGKKVGRKQVEDIDICEKKKREQTEG